MQAWPSHGCDCKVGIPSLHKDSLTLVGPLKSFQHQLMPVDPLATLAIHGHSPIPLRTPSRLPSLSLFCFVWFLLCKAFCKLVHFSLYLHRSFLFLDTSTVVHHPPDHYLKGTSETVYLNLHLACRRSAALITNLTRLQLFASPEVKTVSHPHLIQ